MPAAGNENQELAGSAQFEEVALMATLCTALHTGYEEDDGGHGS